MSLATVPIVRLVRIGTVPPVYKPAIVLQSSLKLDLVFNPNVLKLHPSLCPPISPSLSSVEFYLLELSFIVHSPLKSSSARHTLKGHWTLTQYIPMSQPAPAQASVSQGGQTITVATASNGGGLEGTPPQPFKGDRKKSHAFLVAFGIFQFANWKNEAMSNPATWVTTVLTYMQGPMMEPWKEEQMVNLEARIAGGTADTEEIHWTEFEQAFKNSFTNTNRKQEAFNQLIRLKHGSDSLNVFISEFKRLATAAGVQLNDHGMIYHFKQGLKTGLMQAIIASNAYVPSNP